MPGWPRTLGRACSWAFDRRRAGTLLGAAALALAACTDRDRPIVALDVVDRSGDPAGDDVARALQAPLAEALDGLEGFERRPARRDEVGFQARAVVGLVTDRPAPGGELRRRAVGVSVRLWSLDRVDPVEVRADGLASQELAPDAGFEPVAQAALTQAMARLRAAWELTTAAPSEVVSALAAEDDAIRGAAIAAAAHRRLEAAVEPLGQLLSSDTLPDSVALEIVGALVAIGDPRAVGPIIETVEKRPASYWPQVLFAVGELGGRRAEGFLFTVAKGHEDPAVKVAARDALRELERRKVAEEPEDP